MTHIRNIYEGADTYNKQLQCDDPRFNRCVVLQHRDGTSLTYVGAFLVWFCLEDESEPEYLVVFTEHHKYTVYHEDELNRWYQFTDAAPPEKAGPGNSSKD